jgi:hypothetical protein
MMAMLFVSTLIGILAGAVFGSIFLSFGDLIGRSGNSGAEFVGSWDVADVWLGCLYGGIFGALAAPIAYLTLVRKIGLRKAFLPATAGTLIGGFIGALVGPPSAAFAGVAGFFIALKRAVERSANDHETSRESHL